MKKLTMLAMVVGVIAMFVACGRMEYVFHQEEIAATTTEEVMEESVEEVVETRYTTDARYYVEGYIIDDCGYKWMYSTDSISEEEPYDGMPVVAVFSDNGTEDFHDDIVKGLVYDRETAIYDQLEDKMMESFSDEYEVTRDGNNIRISVKEY